ncbi:MAG TPA: arginine--tRNA ligase [Deltaproteobacteria bacterium]|nr:arginine--tRNA ligase [Deltaproteobacteria bacterium]
MDAQRRTEGVIDEYLVECIKKSLSDIAREKSLKPEGFRDITLEIPKIEDHGDYATNVAMVFAGLFKEAPRKIADRLIACFSDPRNLVDTIEVAGPGFINFFLRDEAWYDVLRVIINKADKYGTSSWGYKKRVQVEFVSANPTGPLHVGHGRGAVVGDVIARALEATGHSVEREYYINDAGRQMEILGHSILLRYYELFGKNVDFPADYYQGDYIVDIAKEVKEKRGDRYLQMEEAEAVADLAAYGGQKILDGIRSDLADFGIEYNCWFSEKSLFEKSAVNKTIEELKEKGFVYEKEGALWFRSSDFGDEKDRVVVRSNGAFTYFASDLAYHRDKFERGFKQVIDVWGADHHGYVPRVMAGMKALGFDEKDLQVVLVQLVSLLRSGEPVAMSTRKGEFVTLREVMDEVGKDAARYIFLTRRSDSHLDFDLELAKEKSSDNPVYYVQYAHARICSLFRVAKEEGIEIDWSEDVDLSVLEQPQEKKMMRILAQYPSVVNNCAKFLEPHRLPYYLNDLVSVFHSYYNKNRIISDNEPLMKGRFRLVKAIQTVIKNALGILGVEAPEKM